MEDAGIGEASVLVVVVATAALFPGAGNERLDDDSADDEGGKAPVGRWPFHAVGDEAGAKHGGGEDDDVAFDGDGHEAGEKTEDGSAEGEEGIAGHPVPGGVATDRRNKPEEEGGSEGPPEEKDGEAMNEAGHAHAEENAEEGEAVGNEAALDSGEVEQLCQGVTGEEPACAKEHGADELEGAPVEKPACAAHGGTDDDGEEAEAVEDGLDAVGEFNHGRGLRWEKVRASGWGRRAPFEEDILLRYRVTDQDSSEEMMPCRK